MNAFTIIIATFNEETTIRECLDRVQASVPGAEIIVVHGGHDRTAELAREWGRAHTVPIRVYDNYGDSGKGHAIKLGITLASHDVMAQFDADMQFAPEDIPAIMQPILDDTADLVIGSRFMEGADRSAYRSIILRDWGNAILNRLISILAGQVVTDVTTGMKAWNKRTIWDVRFRDNRFVYEMEIVLRAARKGYRVIQRPVRYAKRQGGESGHGSGLKECQQIIKTGILIAWRAILIRAGLA